MRKDKRTRTLGQFERQDRLQQVRMHTGEREWRRGEERDRWGKYKWKMPLGLTPMLPCKTNILNHYNDNSDRLSVISSLALTSLTFKWPRYRPMHNSRYCCIRLLCAQKGYCISDSPLGRGWGLGAFKTVIILRSVCKIRSNGVPQAKSLHSQPFSQSVAES